MKQNQFNFFNFFVKFRTASTRTTTTTTIITIILSNLERRLHEHGCGSASQRRHDQDRQDIQGAMHLRHDVTKHHLRNDANQRSGYDQHHGCSRGASTKDLHCRPARTGEDFFV